MSNSYFQFKQFRIEQSKSAMKVCTDSCIFGAYINVESSTRILDIGTGTGLLALMMAQKSKVQIEAVEIEDNAFQQAKENIQESKWSDRVRIHHTSIQDFVNSNPVKFDTIISNPPFFFNQLKSPDKNKNIAHHSESLTFSELAHCVRDLLVPSGNFHLLLPEFEFNQFTTIAEEYQLYPENILSIRDRKDSPIFRTIGQFSFHKKETTYSSMYIKNADGQYSDTFKELLKDYYLHL